MSLIFEALRTAEQARVPAHVDRRRSSRLPMGIPVFVYGCLSGRQPFHERAYLHGVSADGGLLTLSTGVQRGQKLLLTSDVTEIEQKCFVVHSRPCDPYGVQVGIEFARPCPEFAPPDSVED